MLTAALPSKLTRVWDGDFCLVYLFGDGEDYPDGLPLTHPVAKFLHGKPKYTNAYLTTDENGSREVERLDFYEVRATDDGPKLIAHWAE